MNVTFFIFGGLATAALIYVTWNDFKIMNPYTKVVYTIMFYVNFSVILSWIVYGIFGV